MTEQQRFILNEPTVIQEVIEGEAIIADLGRGFYYSLDDLGSRIWNALVSGYAVSEIIELCTSRLGPDAREDIEALLDRLLEEQLIVPSDRDGITPDPEAFFDGFEGPYSPPELAKYTDMEQLLLLDPIHEVDETGWPNKPDSETDAG